MKNSRDKKKKTKNNTTPNIFQGETDKLIGHMVTYKERSEDRNDFRLFNNSGF